MWAWVGRRRHREIIAMCLNHIDGIIETVKFLKEMIEDYKKENMESAKAKYSKVFEKEKEADVVKRNIIAELSKGIFHPIDREDLIRLTLTADDIAAYAKATGRRILLTSSIKIPDNVLSLMLSMAEKVHEATILIKDAIMDLYENPRKSLEVADKIERLEEEVDEIRLEGLEEAFKWCDTVKTSACIMVKEAIDSLENAMDRCEDVADVIRSIALLSL